MDDLMPLNTKLSKKSITYNSTILAQGEIKNLND